MQAHMVTNKNSVLYEMHFKALQAGFRRHGDELLPWYDMKTPPPSDAVIVWGLRRAQRMMNAGKKALVIERGYLGDRLKVYTSFGWNGLNGRGELPVVNDEGQRFNKLFPDLLQPWRTKSNGYVLIMGQIRLDAAVEHTDILKWYQDAADIYHQQKRLVVFRPHPQDDRRRLPKSVPSTEKTTLAQDMEKAALVVSFNSNSSVESVLAGVPTLVVDEGAMAYPICGGRLGDFPQAEPVGREQWAHRLAWRQFSLEEMSYGLAWEVAKKTLSS